MRSILQDLFFNSDNGVRRYSHLGGGRRRRLQSPVEPGRPDADHKKRWAAREANRRRVLLLLGVHDGWPLALIGIKL